MKLGLMLSYSGQQVNPHLELVQQAEAVGYDSVWIAETWGSDCISIASWLLSKTEKISVGTAIMQVPARSPANAAMSCMTLAGLSGNRFMCGLGVSGPQVVEGWHGVGYAKPLKRMREYVNIMRQVMRRDRIALDGEIYQLPYKGEGSVGLGKSLKSILGANEEIPIYTASFTPGGLRLAGEIADGVIPVFLSPEKLSLVTDYVEEGMAKSGRTAENFDLAPFLSVVLDDDLEAARQPVRDMLALYIGGMGAKSKNFYNDYACRLGYAEAAETVQDLYLAGKKEEAAMAIPNELIDEVALVGDEARIREQAKKWQALEGGIVKTLITAVHSVEAAALAVDIFKK